MGSVEEKIDLDFEKIRSSSSDQFVMEVPNFDVETTHEANPTMFSKRRMRPIRSIYVVTVKDKICIMLPFGPLAIMLHNLTGNQGIVFLFGLLGMIPLGDRLNYATEQLAYYTQPTVRVYLLAMFGNATDMIISIQALRKGMLSVVHQSLLGSVFSNMILIPGCAFFAGGIVHSERFQLFNKAAAVVNSGLLLMAVMGILFPALLHSTHSEAHFKKSELDLSRFSSIIMLLAYASYLHFQLTSQQNLHTLSEGEVDEEKVCELSKWEAIGWLAILIAWIFVLSKYLVDVIQEASDSMNLPETLITVVLLPIVEHASAIMFAVKDKLDFTLKDAIGSAIRLVMFVMPFSVLVGWCMGKEMDLNIPLFETAVLLASVLLVAHVLQEGTSHYFKGLMLILCYVIVVASFFVHVDNREGGDD